MSDIDSVEVILVKAILDWAQEEFTNAKWGENYVKAARLKTLIEKLDALKRATDNIEEDAKDVVAYLIRTIKEHTAEEIAHEEPPRETQEQAIDTSVGGDVKGDVMAAGRDVIKASPGDVQNCKVCDGAGHLFTAKEAKIICPSCNGQGKVRL